MSSLHVTELLVEFKKEYLNTKTRIIEFIVCMTSNIIIFFLQVAVPIEAKGFLGQVQGFISVYLAFRFGIIGMVLSVSYNALSIILIINAYGQNNNYSYLVGLLFSALTIAWVMIVGILSMRQEKNRREFRRLAITDDLTGAYNKKYFHSILESEINNSFRSNNSVGLILIDIDNFKMHNDLYGHNYGDTILKNTSEILKKIVDKDQTVYRFGGDEFAVLILNKDLEALEKEAKKLYENYEREKTAYYNDAIAYKITFSVGLSEYPNISKSKEELISHANMALYQAKNMGDDKVNFYQDIMLQIHKDVKSDQQMVGVFKGLLSTINTKDKYTFGHCERVSSYAVMIGEAMGLELQEIQTILYAGILHDIGKIELPKSILNKNGRLTNEEFELIRLHPVYSANILEPLSSMPNLIDYVRHHHERFDGKGYPDGLAGRDISLGARILCVVDSFDAMVSDRSYRKGMSVEDAFMEIEKCSGTQFDPEIAKLFIRIMRNKMAIKYNYGVGAKSIVYKKAVMQKLS